MNRSFKDNAKVLKALADPKRMQIASMLADQELCANSLLAEFQISQPTLSHDMKLLVDAGVVNSRRSGKWIYYSLDKEFLTSFLTELSETICGKPETATAKTKDAIPVIPKNEQAYQVL